MLYVLLMDLQRILLIVLILMVLGGGYYYYQSSYTPPTAAQGSSVVADLNARLKDIRRIASVDLDISIFDNAFFSSLRIITATTGPAVIPGRTNPFLPY